MLAFLIAAGLAFALWQNARFWTSTGCGPWHMGPGHMYGFGFGSGGFPGLIFWCLVLAALIMIIAWISRMVSRAYKDDNGTVADAAEILKQRYARGEIDKKEFEDRLQDIRNLEAKQ